MGYKLLGFIVWKGVKFYLGRRIGPNAGRKALVAGGGVALGAAALVLVLRRSSSDE
jgi:membrane protein DedA with SNARE-associated domain